MAEQGEGVRRARFCKGKGTVPKTENVKVRIPAGVETGSRVRIPGKGQGGRLGAPPGDLHIITNVGTHKYFTRKGDNIYVTVPLTVPEAALGAKIEVPTVEGKAQLRIPPGTQSGQKFRLRQRGAPSLRNPGRTRRSVCRSSGNVAESNFGGDERIAATVFETERGEPACRDGTGIVKEVEWSNVQCPEAVHSKRSFDIGRLTIDIGHSAYETQT